MFTVDQLNEILINDFEVPPEAIHRDALIRDDLDLDSLDAVDLTVTLENKTGIKVNPLRFMNISTLGELHDILEEIMAQDKKE
jgi:acyl carrier protein